MSDLGEGPERKEKTWVGEGAETAEDQLTKYTKQNKKHNLLTEYLSNPHWNVGRNTDDKGHSDEVSEGNEEHVK